MNLAVGRLATSALQPTATQVLWIVDSYLIVFGCLLIPSGAIGDRFGRKGALLCRRGHAVALWTALSGGGGVAGNMVGGVVLQFFDWQALFAVAAPLAALGLFVAAKFLPRVDRHHHSVDVRGVLILVVSVFALLFGIIEGTELGRTSPAVLMAFIAGLYFLTFFVRYEIRREQPLLDPRVFRHPGMRAGTLGIVVSFIAMYSVFCLNGQYLMNVKGYPAALAGLGTAPLAVVIFLVSPRSARLADRYGSRPVVACGLLVVVAGLGLFSLCGPSTPYVLYAACIIVVGVGSGLSNPPLSQAVITSPPAHQAGVGSGINSFSRKIGGALGFAVFGTLLNARFAELGSVERPGAASADRLSAQIREAFTTGMAESLRVVGVILLLASLLVALWLRRPVSEQNTSREKQ
ncbi:MFS transporter [Streptomyces cupreus]|uniref:MFS transporter n=1 Tax=Streptomyces cupreus TaxID=2759956 RepID=UPI001C8FC615